MQAVLHIQPLLAAEKSRTAFFIVGGLLVVWALILSLAIGLRRPGFPGDLRGQRAVSTVTVLLVLATLATAVITSSAPAKAGATANEKPRVAAEVQPKSPSQGVNNAGGPGPGTKASGTGASTAAPGSGGASAGAGTAASSLKLAASPAGLLSFNTKALSAKSGKVSIAFTNTAPIEHNVTIAQGSTVLGATPTFSGSTKTVTLQLKPGTYTFYCSVPGHRQAGMEGTLKVS